MTERFEPYEIQPEFKYVYSPSFYTRKQPQPSKTCVFKILFAMLLVPLFALLTLLFASHRVKEARDPKLSNAYNYTIYKEDHTLGNLIRVYVPRHIGPSHPYHTRIHILTNFIMLLLGLGNF